MTNHKSQITNHKSQITNHKSQITNHKSQITNHIFTLLAFIILLVLSKLMLRGSGLYPKPEIKDIFLLSIFIVYLSISKKSFYFLLIPIILIYSLYTPIGLTFGKPTYQHISSLLATDFLESKEFLSEIPLKNYLYAISILFLTSSFYLIRFRKNISLTNSKVFVILSILFTMYSLSPLKLFTDTYNEWKIVKKEIDILNLASRSKWGNSSLDNSKYDDYILIIGESARKDYHHFYGYPINSTPFLSSTKGVIIDGFTSAGTYTIGSLRLMLTKAETKNWENQGEKAWKPNYELNMIDLIKSSGMKTFWISNHGFLGKWDSPVSSIANKSDYTYFSKSSSDSKENISDFALLSRFNSIIDSPSDKKRFIVLHLYGSHPDACQRIEDYKLILPKDKVSSKHHKINCYISSIHKTDELIKRVYEKLSELNMKKGRTFSMIYISDHGNAHNEDKNGNVWLHNNTRSKYHFNIPLVKISSDDTDRKEYRVFKSGVDFTSGIANWIGIGNKNLNRSIDLFSNENSPTDYGLQKIIDKISLDDKAIRLLE